MVELDVTKVIGIVDILLNTEQSTNWWAGHLTKSQKCGVAIACENVTKREWLLW